MKNTRLILVLLALATGAFAQENPAKLTLAREVIAAMKADQMFNGLAAQMKQLGSQMSSLPADATAEQRQKAEELQGRMMDLTVDMMKGMMAKMDRIYADVYSEAELQAMKAFFLSPAGQSMLDKQPQMMAKVIPLTQEMQQEFMPKMQALIKEAGLRK